MLTPRFVGADVLFDYTGINPSASRVFGFKGCGDEECLILEGMTAEQTDKTIEHENAEHELMLAGMSYWDAHSYLMSQEKAITRVEVKSMTDKVQKVMKVITCQVKDMPDRCMEFVGSMESADRMGDRVHCDGWLLDNYRKNPVFLWAHDYSSLPIGKAVDVTPKDGKLMFRIQFADHPFAETCYKLYKGGFLNAVSVGFAPKDYASYKEGDQCGTDYNQQELLELSGVPVPAHPDALVSARSQGLITVKELEAIYPPQPQPAKTPKPVTQAQLRDEIDYLMEMVNEAGIARESMGAAVALRDVIQRITGCDNPETIEAKALETLIETVNKKIGGK